MTINFLVAVVVWVIVLVVVLIFTVPDVPVGPLLIASVVVLVAIPLWFYPRSKTLVGGDRVPGGQERPGLPLTR